MAWLCDGVAIPGAKGLTYRLTAADVGHKVAVAFTGAKADHVSTTVTSDEVTVKRKK